MSNESTTIMLDVCHNKMSLIIIITLNCPTNSQVCGFLGIIFVTGRASSTIRFLPAQSPSAVDEGNYPINHVINQDGHQIQIFSMFFVKYLKIISGHALIV